MDGSHTYIKVPIPRELQLQYMPIEESSQNRKKWIITGIALIIILAVAFFVFGRNYVFGNPFGSPERAVNTYLDATEKMDSKKLLDCIYMEPGMEVMRTFMEGMIDTLQATMEDADITISIVDRDIDVISQTEDTAKVSVSFIMKTTTSGTTQRQTVRDVMDLVKVDGKWLLIDTDYETYDAFDSFDSFEMTSGG